MIGRRRAFSIGCVIYGCRVVDHRARPNLTVLIIGWSLLEGVGAALIMPAIVALVAANFPPRSARRLRPGRVGGRDRGRRRSADRRAVTTYLTWRLVFVGEVVIAPAILALRGKILDPPAGRPPARRRRTVLSAAGLGLVVFGVLRSGEWGWVLPKAGAPVVGLSPRSGWYSAVWWWSGSSSGGSIVSRPRPATARRPGLLRNPGLVGGLAMFFFQFLLQAGLFFTVRCSCPWRSASARWRPGHGCFPSR